jgi:hypothetical protein
MCVVYGALHGFGLWISGHYFTIWVLPKYLTAAYGFGFVTLHTFHSRDESIHIPCGNLAVMNAEEGAELVGYHFGDFVVEELVVRDTFDGVPPWETP